MSELLMYDGTVSVSFVEDTHKYLISHKVGDKWLEAKPVTGVTTYCNAMSKDFLAPWAAKLAAQYVVDNAGKVDISEIKLIDEAKNQHKFVADSGKRAGKLGHLFVEAKLKGRAVTLPTGEDDLLVVASVEKAYNAFMKDWKPTIIDVEPVLYSKAHNYAGTCDLIAKIDNKLIIMDWKTTNTSRYNPDGIYATYFAQLGGYTIAYEEMTGDKVDDLWCVNLPKDGGEYKLRRLADLGTTKTDCEAYFLSLKQAYEINQQFEWSINR